MLHWPLNTLYYQQIFNFDIHNQLQHYDKTSQYRKAGRVIGASLSEPHTGWSLSWFRTSRLWTVRTIKYGWQAIEVLSWSRTSRVWTVRMIKYGWQAIQVLSWFRTSRVRTVRMIKYGWQAIEVLSWSRTSRVQTMRTIKYDGQAIQRFIHRVCRLWVLRGRCSEGRET